MQEQISANDARACVMVVMLLMIPVVECNQAAPGLLRKMSIQTRCRMITVAGEYKIGKCKSGRCKIRRAVDKERGKNPVCVCGEALCSWKCYENKDQTEAQIWYVDKICSNGFNYS